MALTKTRKLKGTSVEIPDAYCRIKSQLFHHPSHLEVRIGVYKDDVELEYVDFNLTAEDMGGELKTDRKSIYNALKAMDEWSDAEDA